MPCKPLPLKNQQRWRQVAPVGRQAAQEDDDEVDFETLEAGAEEED